MIVLDASVLAAALGDDGADGTEARSILAGDQVVLPDLADVEATAVLRKRRLDGTLGHDRFLAAVEALTSLPVRRYPARPLLGRVAALVDNVTVYDAVYVALAEAVGADLVTADRRLAGAEGIGCGVRVVGG